MKKTTGQSYAARLLNTLSKAQAADPAETRTLSKAQADPAETRTLSKAQAADPAETRTLSKAQAADPAETRTLSEAQAEDPAETRESVDHSDMELDNESSTDNDELARSTSDEAGKYSISVL